MNIHDDRTIWRRLDGEMPEAEARAFDEALANDPVLARRVAELRCVSAAQRGGVPKPPPDFAERVVARAQRGPAAQPFDLDEARRFLRRLVVAAAILAAAGVAAYLAVDVLPKVLDTPLQAHDLLGK